MQINIINACTRYYIWQNCYARMGRAYDLSVAQAKCQSVHPRWRKRKLWSTYPGCCWGCGVCEEMQRFATCFWWGSEPNKGRGLAQMHHTQNKACSGVRRLTEKSRGGGWPIISALSDSTEPRWCRKTGFFSRTEQTQIWPLVSGVVAQAGL